MAAGLTQACSYKACSIYISSDFTGNFDSWHCVSEETETNAKGSSKKGNSMACFYLDSFKLFSS